MSSERNPNFQEELMFLKVLIEGQASLFLYVNGNLTRFFYKKNDSEINQLIYKEYVVKQKIATNEYFKQQLFLDLKCEGIGLNDIASLRYSKRDLKKLFIKYHECAGSNFTNFEPKQKRDLFNLTLRPGLNYSSLDVQHSMGDLRDIDFGYNLGIRFGVEMELIMPFNKNKWGLIIEPTYQYFKSEESKEVSDFSGGIVVSKVDYKSIELPVGLRYYFYFNDKSKLFTNVSYVVDFSMNSTIEFLRRDDSVLTEVEIKSRRSLALGIGYKYKDRYSLEIRYYADRNILGDYLNWKSDYRTISIIMGYSLF